jgi:hypothetical protein
VSTRAQARSVLSFPLSGADSLAPLGDVCYIHILGQGLVFLSSPEATMALLDRRGSIYSDKPHLVMAGEL